MSKNIAIITAAGIGSRMGQRIYQNNLLLLIISQ